ncbi:sugar ABC transporter ATP-binding protein [Lachnospiraceae bacterium ZAX-1]
MELVCKEIKKRFGSVIALSNATLTARSGEILALVGGNGSGKSTLAKILGGSVGQDSGEVLLDGKPYAVKSPIEAKQQGVVITSQELSLLPNLNIVENICLCNMDRKKGIGFLDYRKMEQRTREALGRLGKEDLIYKEISTLPANEQYLLELAKALVQIPRVLIVDEITSALYKGDVALVKTILEELRDKGVIILFISHRLNEVFDMCDSVTVLRNGDTVGTIKSSELSEMELISHMSGRDVTQEHATEHTSVKREGLKAILQAKIHLEEFNKNVELDVMQGEFIGVAGLAGQGQSEMLRTLFGMEHPIDITFHGQSLRINSPAKAIKSGFAFLSGDRGEGTFKERSIAENFNAVNSLVLNRKNEDDVDTCLKKNGVKYSAAKDLITSLSGGNQQKVVIARWTYTGAKILLADDPTKGIDIQARRDVHETFRRMIKEGTSVIMISSDDEELVETSKMMPLSRVVVIYEGQIARTLIGEDINIEAIAAAANSAGQSNSGVG